MPPSPASSWLVVGLGNPDERYESTFHNMGFVVADVLARRGRDPGDRWRRKFSGRILEIGIGRRRVCILKPWTYMNLSGESVGPAAGMLGVSLDRIVVVHDDLDLSPGDVRVKVAGGSGGHKGLESCIRHLGGPGFARVRIGIGRHERMPAERYVLSRIPEAWRDLFASAAERAADAATAIVEKGAAPAMNEFNRRERDEG